MKRRLLTLLLTAALLGSSMLACSDAPADDGTAGTPTASDTAVTPEDTAEPEAETTALEARKAEADNLPDKDFGGRNFTVIGTSSTAFEKYIHVEEQTGEGVNDAVYARNLAVEERYNAKVAYIDGSDHRTCTTTIANEIQAGDTSFDLIQYHVVSNSGNVLKGFYRSWGEVPYVDFSRPWWSDSTVDDLTINGRCYLAMGDFALSTIAQTYCMFYDKDAMVNYQIEDLYDVVKSGRWTLDFLKNMCETVYTDTNGDGAEDELDYFGLASDQQSNYNTYLWACDNPIFVKDTNGEHQFVYYSEHLVDVYNSCYELLNNTTGVYSKMDHGSGMDLFSRYGTLTCNAVLSGALTYLADFEHDYGIIPYPKYDENQAEYKSMVDGSHEAMAVGKSATDLEFIGIMTEVLCAESYKEVLPTYYDVCLKQRYASSQKDAEMMDLCVNARVFDFGYVYDNWNGVAFYFQELLRSETFQDITSYYKSKEKAANKYYQKVIDKFYEEG